MSSQASESDLQGNARGLYIIGAPFCRVPDCAPPQTASRGLIGLLQS